MTAPSESAAVDLARSANFALGDALVRPSSREFIARGEVEILEPRVMQVLVALARQAGEVISRDELIQACWAGRVVGEDAIQRCIAKLRRLAEAGDDFSVETIQRVGYRLHASIGAAPARSADEATSGAAAARRREPGPIAARPRDMPRAIETSRTGVATRRRKKFPLPARSLRRLRWIAVAGTILVLAGAGGAWLLRERLGGGNAAPPARVAVLPFQAVGGGRDAASFADGLLDEILSVLSANRATAISRTESAALRTADPAAVRRLGAALLLDGTVEQAGDRIKVRVHLDDAATRTILWSEEFERPASEPEPLQGEVAAKATTLVAYALEARPAGLPNDVLADYISATEHIRFDWNGGVQAAEPILRRVVRRAPRFAGGHGSLAVALAFQMAPGNPRVAELRAEAEREARTALTLDRGGYGAYAVLALLRPEFDWQGRETLYDKGLVLDGSDAGIPYRAGGELAQTGRLNAAAEVARRGVALDPLWPGPTYSLGLRLLDAGVPTEGLAMFDRMAEIWPQHVATLNGRFWATAMYGDPGAALALLADPRTTPPVDRRGAAIWRQFLTAVRSGTPADRTRAATAIEGAEKAGATVDGAAMAMLARLGDLNGAFAAADHYVDRYASYDVASPPFLFIAATQAMRRDPRFMPLVARMGLPQYWRASGNWPDFCSEPGLPYDCKAEAAKLARAHP